jgi:hypothetical protein
MDIRPLTTGHVLVVPRRLAHAQGDGMGSALSIPATLLAD